MVFTIGGTTPTIPVACLPLTGEAIHKPNSVNNDASVVSQQVTTERPASECSVFSVQCSASSDHLLLLNTEHRTLIQRRSAMEPKGLITVALPVR